MPAPLFCVFVIDDASVTSILAIDVFAKVKTALHAVEGVNIEIINMFLADLNAMVEMVQFVSQCRISD